MRWHFTTAGDLASMRGYRVVIEALAEHAARLAIADAVEIFKEAAEVALAM
jgi:hypothetical protein